MTVEVNTEGLNVVFREDPNCKDNPKQIDGIYTQENIPLEFVVNKDALEASFT